MIKKFFWDLNARALKETQKALRNPKHPQFAQRMVALLSRCDQPKELFSIIPKKTFAEAWPRIRGYWVKRMQRSDARDWWETIYEQMLEVKQRNTIKIKGMTPSTFRKLGSMLKEARLQKGLSQKQLALHAGMKQPDISSIEEGKRNITLFTLMRLCKVLGIKKIETD